ncbi:hypothetical protein LCGC14_2069290 [marine sediment metagenome]|uniref:Uncharacterized protein n=1 Tax=marine sediment metagenome TaxID=412755 RepID=A0A0F9HFY1_9ZZZZ
MNIQQKYRHWAIEIKHWDSPSEVHLKLYDQYKDATKKVKRAIKEMNTTVTEEEIDSLVWKMMEKSRWK